ncbi:hypothetical protein PENTCL1PPCAC_26382, partial [Pristionchus entomophagus]
LYFYLQISEAHPIQKRCLASPCRDETVSPNIKILLETVDDETRKPVQQATGYYIANKNYSLSMTPPPPAQSTSPHYLPPSSYHSSPPIPTRPYSTPSPHSFHFLPPSSSSQSSIVSSPIFIRSDPLPPLVSSVYKNPSGVVRPSSQLQPPFVLVKMKKVTSSPPPIEIITTPRSQATLIPTTTVSPPTMTSYSTHSPHSFHFIPSSPSPPSTPSLPTVSSLPPLRSQVINRSTTTVPVSDRVETTTATAAEPNTSSQIIMSEEELRRRVAAMLDKNQLLCTMFGICDGMRGEGVLSTATPKTVYNPTPTENQFEFRPRIVTSPTTPYPFQFVFEFASTMAPTLHKLNKQLPLYSARYAANPSPIQPHPKSLNGKGMTLSSLLSSIVSSPLASHCPSCVQLLLNLCPSEGRTSRDCGVTTTTSGSSPCPFPSSMKTQKTFSFSFPNPITGQRIEAAAAVPTTTTLRPWQTTYRQSPPSTTLDPFAPLDDDEDIQYDFDFDKGPAAEIQYDEGGGYGLVGEKRGLLPWSVKTPVYSSSRDDSIQKVRSKKDSRMNALSFAYFLIAVKAENNTEISSIESKSANSSFESRLYDRLLERTVMNDEIQSLPLFYNDRWFFWDYSVAITRKNEHICVHELNDTRFDTVHFPNGTLVSSLFLICMDSEDCCGAECCERVGVALRISRWFLVILAFLMILVMIEECVRHTFDCLIAVRWREYRKRREEEKMRLKFEKELVATPLKADPLSRSSSKRRLSFEAHRTLLDSSSRPLPPRSNNRSIPSVSTILQAPPAVERTTQTVGYQVNFSSRRPGSEKILLLPSFDTCSDALQTYREEEITDDSGIVFGTLHDAINYRSPFYGEKVPNYELRSTEHAVLPLRNVPSSNRIQTTV